MHSDGVFGGSHGHGLSRLAASLTMDFRKIVRSHSGAFRVVHDWTKICLLQNESLSVFRLTLPAVAIRHFASVNNPENSSCHPMSDGAEVGDVRDLRLCFPLIRQKSHKTTCTPENAPFKSKVEGVHVAEKEMSISF